MKKKIIIAGGGTGGHIIPGINIAKNLYKHNWNIKWIGVIGNMESYLVPMNGIKIELVKIQPIRDKNLFRKLISVLVSLKSLKKLIRIINKFKPDVVLCMGGYVSGPVGLAAWIKNIPMIVHEQNSVAGLTNKILSKLSSKTLQAFPNVFKKAITVGNPICKKILKIPNPDERLKDRFGPIRILVFGGSQGSNFINRIIPILASNLKDKIKILHQVGFGFIEDKKKHYEISENLRNYRLINFIYDMSSVYNWADLVICRSGAITISEISSVGIASILIPIVSKDNHQYLNAKILENTGSAIIIEQRKLNVKILIKIIKKLNRNKLILMAKKSKLISTPQATENIVKEINELKYHV